MNECMTLCQEQAINWDYLYECPFFLYLIKAVANAVSSEDHEKAIRTVEY